MVHKHLASLASEQSGDRVPQTVDPEEQVILNVDHRVRSEESCSFRDEASDSNVSNKSSVTRSQPLRMLSEMASESQFA